MSVFPTNLDTFTTKSNGDTLQPAHVNDLQDAVSALEAKVGVDGSSVATSLTKKVADLQADGIVQIVNATPYTDYLSTSSTIEIRTTPTITQGSEVLSCSFVPVYANSKIVIDVTADILCFDHTFSPAAITLFSGSGPGAICGAVSGGHEGYPTSLSLHCEIDAGTTDARIYSVRAGACWNGVLYVNGDKLGSLSLGANTGVRMRIMEVKA